MKTELLDIPDIHYFIEKNKFSGSIGKSFRFKIVPNEKLCVFTWHGHLCFEETEKQIIESSEFEKTDDGLKNAMNWIENKFRAIPNP